MSDLLIPPELLIPWLAYVGLSVFTSIWSYYNWHKIPPEHRGVMMLVNVSSYFIVILSYVLLKLFVA